jgi:hypothetical protein
MAKKKTSSKSKGRPASARPKSSSSIVSNSFVKGMNKDIAPSMENNMSWWHARNAVNNSNDGDVGLLGNEPANLQCGVIPYTIIGAIHRYGDEWIIYSTDNNNSEIGTFDDSECKYTTLVNDPCLNFNTKFLITGASKENFDCTWEVYWDDGNNPSRAMNIDDIPYKQEITSAPGDPCVIYENILPLQLDCEQIRLAPLLDTPCVKLNKNTDGGLLSNGSYQAFVAYTENEQRVTDYIGVSNIQTLWSHAGSQGSLDISISNLDEDYEYFELVLLVRNQGQTFAKKIGLYSTQQVNINIDYIDPALTAVALDQIPLRSPAYEKSESMFVVNDYLIRQGPTEQFDFNYQPIANQIQVNWVINQQDSTYYSLGGNNMGFMRDEQYAFFIRWIYNTGERSSSYHIPGRAPENYTLDNGNTVLENEIIFGENVIDPNGDPVYKVYNTGSITQQGLQEISANGDVITARGKMGYWESTERYPSNRPDIWGDLCGLPIRHHKMPTEEIGNAGPLHITKDNGDTMQILGVEFENIGRPTNNDGTFIENVVGYEILRGSRLGARSILAKGLFRNMRKYTVPNAQDLIGDGVQGLYPNYPYNDLRPDIYFHDGIQGGPLNRTSGCDSFTQSLGVNGYRALGDRPDVDGEPAGYSRKVFTFSSPELMFTKPFLNAFEARMYGQLTGNAFGYFKPSEDHPQFKLLRNGGAVIASLIGLGYAFHQVRGTDTSSFEGARAAMDSVSGNWGFGGPAGAGYGVQPGGWLLVNGPVAGAAGAASTVLQIVEQFLIDDLIAVGDFYSGGAVSQIATAVSEGIQSAEGGIPGVIGGMKSNSTRKDTSVSNLPFVVRVFAGMAVAKANVAIGGNEIIDLIYAMVNDSDFAWKHNSSGFFDTYRNQTNGLWRIKCTDSNYLGSSFQTFNKGEYKINNLFRPSTVAVAIDKPISDPDFKDKSRYVVGGEVEMNLNAQGEYVSSQPIPFSDNYLLDPGSSKKRQISAYYGALKFNMDNQYGQLAGIKQIQMRGCVELLDPTKPNQFKYKSQPIFSGDTFIGRYTEKTIMPIFSNYLQGQPDGYTFDYSLYVNIPYPRYWLNSQRFDLTPLAGEIATLGLQSENALDAKFPDDLYYLDRGNDSCNTGLSAIFGNANDPNPALAMRFAYIYTHNNGILDFYVESEINLDYRDWEESPARRIYSVYDYNDLDELFHARIEKADNFYKYDESLSPSKFVTQIGSFGQVQPLDYDPLVAETCFTSYPKRLVYSLRAQEESKKDFWRVFLNFNYKDFKGEVSVIKPFSKNGALVFFPYLSPQLFQGVDVLKTQLDTKVTIGDGGLFSQPMQNVANSDLSNEYGSSESLRGVMNTPMGLFFISQAQGKIFQYAGKGLDPISNKGMKWWFNKYLPSSLIRQFPELEHSVLSDNPIAGVGCQTVYDTNNDIVYFCKRDYKVKKEYISNVTYTEEGGFKFNVTAALGSLGTGSTIIDISIGDPVYFDDCSWTVSYDPKAKAWISFHDWHPELTLPSINHFFTTKTLTTDVPQCPPGFNYNPTSFKCERADTITEPATITVDNGGTMTLTGGTQACLLDIVIATDMSTSTMGLGQNPNNPGTRAFAQQQWIQAFLQNPLVINAQQAGTMQIGFTAWANLSQSWDVNNTGSPAASTQSMVNNITTPQARANVLNWYAQTLAARAWPPGTTVGTGTNITRGLTGGQALLNNKAASALGDRSGQGNFTQIILLITDTTSPTGPNTQFQSSTIVPGGPAPANQFVYALYCGVNSPVPVQPLVLNNITSTGGPPTISPGTAGISTDRYQFGIQSTIDASYPITNWDMIATEFLGQICTSTPSCSCPAGYTIVYPDANGDYTQATGTCDPVNPPICRRVLCDCPTSQPGYTTTVTGDCPDSAPLIYQVDTPTFTSNRVCNYQIFEQENANFEVGSIWRHNARCDSYVNFYKVDYPWEIDLIENTGQIVNTVRSIEYQLETYVYKNNTLGNACGEDKWEDLEFNFDHAIVYNNDQVSGLLNLNMQPYNDPWGELNYPIINNSSIDILSSKVEHKFRFNQFFDITNDRGEFTNVEQPIFNTQCNGYIRPLNALNLNYDKSPTQRKKFRHYSNQLILRKNRSGDRKMLLRLNNTKLLLSKR